MNPTRCRICGQLFVQAHSLIHVCDECLDDIELETGTDPIASELADPAVKARIEAGVAKRREEP